MPVAAAVVVAAVVMAIAAESAMVPLRLTVASPRGTNTTVTFTAEEEALREMELTKEMMESSVVHSDAKGRVSHEPTADSIANCTYFLLPLTHAFRRRLRASWSYTHEGKGESRATSWEYCKQPSIFCIV